MSSRAIPEAGAHGGDGAAVAEALGMTPAELLDLSASMNPAAVDPAPILARHMRAGVAAYPDPQRATAALAEAVGVAPERLLLTNGGAEAIALLAAEIGGRVIEPEFALYPRGVRPAPNAKAGETGHIRPRLGAAGGVQDPPLWRSNPHSPSGLLAAPTEHADVWDEAFYPLATGEWTRGDDAAVVGSLTKLLAVPGLRIGYVLADPDLIAACARRQPAWSVNGLACAALPDLLTTIDLAASARAVAELRRELIDLLSAHGLTAWPSDANWVLVEAPGLRERLAPHGVLVRDCASFGLPGIARIAVPDADGLTLLDSALTATESATDPLRARLSMTPPTANGSARYDPLMATIAAIRPIDRDTAGAAADARSDELAKPRGALGRLESLGSQLAAIARSCPPPIPTSAALCVFAADHGVRARGVSPWPAEVTAQMVATLCSGNAAVTVLARQLGAAVTVVDMGVATPVPGDPPNLLRRVIRLGTDDLSLGPAMTIAEARAAIRVGIEIATQEVSGGADLLVTGEMGIGNTTAAAALIAAITGLPAAEVTGRGTGIDDATLTRKTALVAEAVARLDPDADPMTVLAEVGGLEIAALTGFVLGGAAAGMPVLMDGVISGAAALVACALAPETAGYLIAGHLSAEPGAAATLRHLGLMPLLDLDMRLGEGSGAVLAVPLVQAAARILSDMATFEEVAADTT